MEEDDILSLLRATLRTIEKPWGIQKSKIFYEVDFRRASFAL